MFQSSPDPKAGCNWATTALVAGVRVSILTRPEGRVQPLWLCSLFSRSLFQSSPDPKAGCNITDINTQIRSSQVSILTRPEGRVQLVPPTPMWRYCWFQSSPDPKAGCNVTPSPVGTKPMNRFNPHPTRRPGATLPESTHAWSNLCFNPHPTRRPGATINEYGLIGVEDLFQSSPDPKAGCNLSASAL